MLLVKSMLLDKSMIWSLVVGLGLLIVVGTVLVMAFWRPNQKNRPHARHVDGVSTMSSPDSMYVRLGVRTIRVAVEQFYRRVLADSRTSVFFENLTPDGLERLKRHQVMLISQVLGGPVQYTDMAVLTECHRSLRIGDDTYAFVVAHMYATLCSLQAPPDIIKHLLVTLEDVRPLIAVSSRIS